MKDTKTNRRSFIKATAGGAALAAFSGNSSQAQEKETSSVSGRNPIMAHHEWGTLKEVIVGYPYFYAPKKFPPYFKNFVNDASWQRYEKCQGATVEERLPEIYRAQVQQTNAVIRILESRGVKVYQLKRPTELENSYLENQGDFYRTTSYPRDEVVVVGNNYIETALYYPGRRSARWSFRRAVGDRLKNSNARIVSMPEPPNIMTPDGDFGPGPFIEGGDTLLFGRDILVGNSGNASNSAGIEWLARYLGDEYRVHEVKLTKGFLHLDCCLCAPRPGLAVICRDAFVDGIPDLIKDWEFIEVTHEEAEGKLATNHLVFDDKTIICSTSTPHISEALRKAGQEVIETPFDSMFWHGGSFRCWHHPLVRESKLEKA